VLSFPWKITFALVPPPSVCGGWLCFTTALVFIGLLTALIGDLASQMGCCMGLLDSVTAITFVALGTSLPDTFASKTAAQNETHADSSVGNITGSNSVNVFLGLGLPWATAAVYWGYLATPETSAAWHARYSGEDWFTEGLQPGFAVPAGDLGFSVGVFTFSALCCLLLLAARRKFLGCELGGPALWKALSALLLLCLWLFYIVLSVLSSYGLLS